MDAPTRIEADIAARPSGTPAKALEATKSWEQELAEAKAEGLKSLENGHAAPAAERSESPTPAESGEASSSEEPAKDADEKSEKSAESDKPPEPADQKTRERLALLAREQKRFEREKAEFGKAIEASKGDLTKLQKMREARTSVDKVRIMLDGDDEAVARLFLELNDWHANAPEPGKPREKSVDEIVEEKLRARDEAAAKDRQARTTTREASYVDVTLKVLESKADDYPLASLGVTGADILAIVKGAFEASGEVPEPETILKEIESYRAEKLAKRRKPEKPADAAASGSRATTSTPTQAARSNAPVNSSRPMTWDEELENAKREAGITAGR